MHTVEVKKTEKDGFNFLKDLHEIDNEISYFRF